MFLKGCDRKLGLKGGIIQAQRAVAGGRDNVRGVCLGVCKVI